MIALTPAHAFAPTDVPFAFGGTNTVPVTALPGVNTLLLSSSTAPVADIVAMSSTLDHDGIVNLPDPAGTSVFAVATANLGTGATITVSTDTGTAGPAVTVVLCRTNADGTCATAPAEAFAAAPSSDAA